MAPFTVSHANCLSVLAALLCAAPSSDIGAKPSGVQRGGSVAMWQACFRGKHHPQRAAVWQKACQLDMRQQDAWIWGWHWGLRCCRGHVGWGTWLGSVDPQNGRVWLCSQCMVHGGRVTAAFWWPFLQPFLQVWGVLSAQDLQTWDLCLGYKFGSYHIVIAVHTRAVSQPIHRRKLQDETKYLFVKLWRKQSLAALPLPLSSITVFKPYKWIVTPVVSATQMFAISMQLGSVK